MIFNNVIKTAKLTLPNGVSFDLTEHLAVPIAYEPIHDRTLDSGAVELVGMYENEYVGLDVTKPIEPYSILEIQFENQQTEIRMIVQSDVAELRRMKEPRFWNHNLKLVEEGKLLERDISDTCIFATPIDRHYDADATAEWVIFQLDSVVSSVETGGWIPPEIRLSYEKNTVLEITDNASTFDRFVYGSEKRTINKLELVVVTPSGKRLKYPSLLNAPDEREAKYYDTPISILLNESGEYQLLFNFYATAYFTANPDDSFLTSAIFETTIASSSATDVLKPYTIAQCIDRLLTVSEIHRASQENRYYLSEKDRQELGAEEAPNFSFTVRNLAEGLQQIGSYRKERKVRLRGREISYHPLFNGTVISQSDLPAPIKIVRSRSGDDYATFLDCTASNVVAMLDGKKATITEPYIDGWKTTRSSSKSAITEDTAMIDTGVMYQYVGLQMGTINGTTVGDITPYVYEDGDYNALSDNSNAFPFSKAYALKWTQMGQGITEIGHRVTTTTSEFIAVLERPAIANISGTSEVGVGVRDHIVDLLKSAISGDGFSYETDAESFASLMFQVEYNPSRDIRSRVYRDYGEGFSRRGGLLYNQSETVVDSELLGENLHGSLSMMGHGQWYATYIFKRLDDVPKVGTMVDDWLIYSTSMQIRNDCVIVTIAYTVYADVAPSAALQSEWRGSDISTKKYAKRNINYGEFGYFSHVDTNEYATAQTMLNGFAPERLLTFDSPRKISAVKAVGITGDGVKLNTVILPVAGFPIGHSIQLHWEYVDNYSAGTMSVEAPNNSVSTLSGTRYNRAQKAVQYCDNYGRFRTYDFELMRSGPVANDTGISWDLPITDVSIITDEETRIATIFYPKYPYQLTIELEGATEKTISPPVESTSETVQLAEGQTEITVTRFYLTDAEFITRQIGHSLPLFPESLKRNGHRWNSLETYFRVNDLLVDKNSSEALIFDVQFHFKQDFKDFIIGNGIAQFSSLLGGSSKNIGLYGFPNGLNRYERYASMTGAVKLAPNLSWTWNQVKNRMECVLPESVDGYPAWGLIGYTDSGMPEIIFAETSKEKAYEKNLYLYFAGNECDWQNHVQDDVQKYARFHNETVVLPYPIKSIESADLSKYAYFHAEKIKFPYPIVSTTVDIIRNAKFHSEKIKLDYPIVSSQIDLFYFAKFYSEKIKLDYAIKSIDLGTTLFYSAKFHAEKIKKPYAISNNKSPLAKYTFANWDGSVIESGYISVLETPRYKGETPKRSSDNEYTYRFIGWDKTPAPIFTDTVYTAVYERTARQYTIQIDWTNQKGTVLYGQTIYGRYTDVISVSPANDMNHYTRKTVTVKIADYAASGKATLHGYDGNYYTATLNYKDYQTNEEIQTAEKLVTQYPNSVGSVWDGAPSTIVSNGITYTFSFYRDVFGNYVSKDDIKNAQLTDNTAVWYALYGKKGG